MELFKKGEEKLTRRKVLSMIMSEYDPLGLISPALVGSKILLRGLYGKNKSLGWDSPLEPADTREWLDQILSLLSEGSAVFPRSTRPQGVSKGPGMAGFADASRTAMCVAIYLVWEKDNGEIVVRLLLGKCRVAPLHGTTIPRGELQAFVMLLRLVRFVIQSLDDRPIWVEVFTDSMCKIAVLKKAGAPFKPYFANKVRKTKGSSCRESTNRVSSNH
jgi:hypothetical protein